MYVMFIFLLQAFAAKPTTAPESKPPLNCEPTFRCVRNLDVTAS